MIESLEAVGLQNSEGNNMSFFKKKTFAEMKESGKSSALSRSLGAMDLIIIGIGAIIGTGVFVLSGQIAANYSGPAIMLSYAIAGLTCIFVALAYSELATMLPVSGGVYSYSYVAYGEVFAWMLGGVLILEFVVGTATVASGWSGYILNVLENAGIVLPDLLTKIPSNGGLVNLPSILILSFIGFILYKGTSDSKKLNAVLVTIKISAIGLFIFLSVPNFDSKNWTPFMPFGFNQVIAGSSILFFAYTGFGGIAAAAEECKNPSRDLKIGIIGSISIAVIVYIIVSGLLTGIVSYKELNNSSPLAKALTLNGSRLGSTMVGIGAISAMTAVMLVQLYSASRVFYAIGRDGVIPGFFAKLHPKYQSPYITIIIFTVVCMILSGFFPLTVLAQISSMGAIFDYMIVTSIMLLFRVKYPEIERPFKCPAAFIVAPLAFFSCVYLLYTQIINVENGKLLESGKAFIYWFIAVFILYVIKSFLPKKVPNEQITAN
jgi:basic amino acid/polyamine antiporter, APA family